MVQHVLLTMVAAPLLAAGWARRPGPRSRPGGSGWERAPRVHPLATWLIFAVTGWAVHFSPLFEAAVEHSPVHVLEHALMLGTAVAFWAQVTGPRARLSHPLRLLYLVVAMPQNTFLALAIFSSTRVLYPHYGAYGQALGDQRRAGGIMWVAGDLVLLASVLLVAAAWARHEDRQNLNEEAGQLPSPRTTG
jgi:cytochrome c oxidase assembly factor CtaG